MDEDASQMDVLGLLERGEIDVAEAERRLGKGPGAVPAGEPAPEARAGPAGWLLLFASGIAVAAGGGYLASLGGWWWLLAVPMIVAGVLLLLFGVAASESPWLQIRVRTGAAWPARLAIWLPIPIPLAAWGVRVARPWMRSRERAAVDEVFLALEGSLSPGRLITIDVDAAQAPEQVRVTVNDPRRSR
jgi:hypothetical protein